MSGPNFLSLSLRQLIKITEATYNKEILPIAKSIWRKDLQTNNPIWGFVEARPFSIDDKVESAHVLAMFDKRLPKIGLVGYFACTNISLGANVLRRASAWLKEKHGVRGVYGPINGTITRDYRLNLSDDYRVLGEPVNPKWHIDAFREAEFAEFNHYVSGKSKYYKFFTRFITSTKPDAGYSHLVLRPFDIDNQIADLKIYHELMNTIFVSRSIYCPVLSWEERAYNLADNDPIFDPTYTFFLEDHGHAVGFVIAHSYRNELIVKTVGILPEYRGKHLFGLLLRKVHDQAKKEGLEAAIYSTIRVGNEVYKMKRPGVKIYRRYMTMRKEM